MVKEGFESLLGLWRAVGIPQALPARLPRGDIHSTLRLKDWAHRPAEVLGGVRALTERRLAGADAAAALKVSRHVSESHARQSGEGDEQGQVWMEVQQHCLVALARWTCAQEGGGDGALCDANAEGVMRSVESRALAVAAQLMEDGDFHTQNESSTREKSLLAALALLLSSLAAVPSRSLQPDTLPRVRRCLELLRPTSTDPWLPEFVVSTGLLLSSVSASDTEQASPLLERMLASVDASGGASPDVHPRQQHRGHTEEVLATVQGIRVRDTMRWLGARAAASSAASSVKARTHGERDGDVAVAVAVAAAAEGRDERAGAVWACAGLLHGARPLAEHHPHWRSLLVRFEHLLRLSAESAVAQLARGCGFSEGTEVQVASCRARLVSLACCGALGAGAMRGAARDPMLRCLLHCLFDHVLTVPGGEAASLARQHLSTPEFSHVGALLTAARTLAAHVPEGADPELVAGELGRFTSRLLVRHRGIDPAPASDKRGTDAAEAARTLLGWSFHVTVGLLTDALACAVRPETRAALLDSLGNVQFCRSSTPAYLSLLDHAVACASTDALVARALAAALPPVQHLTSPHASGPPVWVADTALGCKMQLCMALVAAGAHLIPPRTLIERVAAVSLTFLQSPTPSTAHAAHVLMAAVLARAKEEDEALCLAESCMRRALAAYPKLTFQDDLTGTVASVMDALHGKNSAQLGIISQLAGKSSELSHENSDKSVAAANHLLDLLCSALAVVDFPLLLQAMDMVKEVLMQIPQHRRSGATVKLQAMISQCNDYARKMPMVEWFLRMQSAHDSVTGDSRSLSLLSKL